MQGRVCGCSSVELSSGMGSDGAFGRCGPQVSDSAVYESKSYGTWHQIVLRNRAWLLCIYDQVVELSV
eukprot:IDg1497t1